MNGFSMDEWVQMQRNTFGIDECRLSLNRIEIQRSASIEFVRMQASSVEFARMQAALQALASNERQAMLQALARVGRRAKTNAQILGQQPVIPIWNARFVPIRWSEPCTERNLDLLAFKLRLAMGKAIAKEIASPCQEEMVISDRPFFFKGKTRSKSRANRPCKKRRLTMLEND